MVTKRGAFAAVLAVSTMLFVFHGTGCKKKKKPDASSPRVRCADLADDLAGALQASGQVPPSKGEAVIAKFHRDLRKACEKGSVDEKVFKCVAKAEGKGFAKMTACLPEKLQALVPESIQSDGSEGEGGEEEGDSDEE